MIEIDIRAQILHATEARFSQYGYNKTTMAEIARDCDMSAANLYRYFENKLAIGAALANGCLAEKELELSLIVRDADTSSAEKLRRFVGYLLNYGYHHHDTTPRIGELIEAISRQKPDIVMAHRQCNYDLMQELLERGRQQGEFVFGDLDQTTEAINTAIIPFSYPPLMSLFSLSEFERKADSVIKLILRGITKGIVN